MAQRGKQQDLRIIYKPQERQYTPEELQEAEKALEKVIDLILQKLFGEEIVPS